MKAQGCVFRLIQAVLIAGAVLVSGANQASAQVRGPAYAAVQGVKIGTYDDFTRLLLRVNVPVAPQLFTLTNPDRLVIDMPRLGWQIPKPSGLVKSRLVKGYRFGLAAPNVSRLVFALSGPAQIVDYKMKPIMGQLGFEMDIALAEGPPALSRAEATAPSGASPGAPVVVYGDRSRAAVLPNAPVVDTSTRQAFRDRRFDPATADHDALGALIAGLNKGKAAPEPKVARVAPQRQEVVTVVSPAKPAAPVEVAPPVAVTPASESVIAKVAPPAPAAPKLEKTAKEETSSRIKFTSMIAALGPKLKPTPEAKPKRVAPRRRPVTIVIDPGHGGKDPGAGETVGLREASTVLAFSEELMALLESDPNYRAYATRRTDTFVELPDRVEFARDKNASLFISIHADWFSDPSVGGAGVFMLSEEDSIRSTAKLVANGEDKIAGIEVQKEREDVVRVLLDLSRRETQIWSRRFADMVREELALVTPLKRNFVKHNNFHVLKAPDMPSVLLELGYMSNEDDRERLTSAAWRKEAAKALKAAIDKWRIERGTREIALR